MKHAGTGDDASTPGMQHPRESSGESTLLMGPSEKRQKNLRFKNIPSMVNMIDGKSCSG
jgi:hypothetical protein